MKLEEIKEIIDLMTEHGLSEFEMEQDGARVSIKKAGGVAPVPVVAAPVVVPVAAAAPTKTEPSPALSAEPAISAMDAKLAEVKAPFVGTFYRASSPDAEPYVTVGQEVGPDSVLCVIEAMKVMNELKAEMSGVVREILVENARAVQYGQPLFRIEKL